MKWRGEGYDSETFDYNQTLNTRGSILLLWWLILIVCCCLFVCLFSSCCERGKVDFGIYDHKHRVAHINAPSTRHGEPCLPTASPPANLLWHA